MLQRNALNDLIAKIGQSQAELREDIHVACVNIIGHAFIHGDVTLGDRLLDAAKGSDRKAIVDYLKTFGPFSLDAETGTFKVNKKFRNEHEFDESTLMDGTRWYEFVPTKKQVMASFDVSKRIQSVLKQAQDKLADGKEVDNAQLISFIESAIKQYNGAKAKALRELAEVGDMEPAANMEDVATGPQRTGTEG